MKADIPQPPVRGVFLALVIEPDFPDTPYTAYFINENMQDLSNAMVVSKGYGEVHGQQIQTSTLRHFTSALRPKVYSALNPFQLRHWN